MDFNSLVDDIIFDIFDYLEPKDRLSLALCGLKWFHLYGQHIQHKKSFTLPRCHLLTVTVFSNLMKNIPLQHIQQFDLTGCNCLPTSWLVNMMYMMPDLRALLVSDTNLSLIHVLDALPHCQNLTTLAFSFSEKRCSKWNSLDDLLHLLWSDKQSETLITSFNRIECLKMTSTSTVMGFWAIVARILSWCINCRDVHLEWQFVRQESYLQADNLKMKYFVQAQKNITRLPCVKKLRSLTFLIRNTSIPRYANMIDFLNCLFNTSQLKLQRLCVTWPCTLQYFGASIFSPNQPSIFIERNTAQPLPLLNNFSSLIRIDAFKISSLGSAGDLRSCSVTCNDTWEWFDLCRQNQNLKKQCIYLKEPVSYHKLKRCCQVSQLENMDIVVDEKEYSSPLKQKITADLIASCPNIQQLSIREWNRPRRLCEDVLPQIIQLEKLKTLMVCLNGIQSIEMIVNGCRQLECLHVWLTLCGTQSIIDFTDGITTLNLPEGMREFAIDWDCFDGPKPNYPSQPSSRHQLNHKFMLPAAERWATLNVLILKSSCGDDDLHKLPETIVHLVSRLSSLSHLALIGEFPTDLVRIVKVIIRRKIQSVRPSFRLYIGPQLYHMYCPYE